MELIRIKVVVKHFLTRLEYLKVKGRIEPVLRDNLLFIYPSTSIELRLGRPRDLLLG